MTPFAGGAVYQSQIDEDVTTDSSVIKKVL
jgi:hypothetical protein